MSGAGDVGRALRPGHPDPSILAGGLTGRANPSTSRSAAQTDQTGTRRTIESFVRENGPQGVTAADVVHEGLAESVQLAGARLLELRGDRVGFARRVARVHTADGWVVRARPGYRAGIVHVHVDHAPDLPDGTWLAPAVDRVPCACCGHVRRMTPWPGPPAPERITVTWAEHATEPGATPGAVTITAPTGWGLDTPNGGE